MVVQRFFMAKVWEFFTKHGLKNYAAIQNQIFLKKLLDSLAKSAIMYITIITFMMIDRWSEAKTNLYFSAAPR